MAKNNMGIADREFVDGAVKLVGYATALDLQIQTYMQILKTVCSGGIQDQLIQSRLAAICEQAQSVRQPLNEIVSQAAKDCRAFIKDIDEADQFLY